MLNVDDCTCPFSDGLPLVPARKNASGPWNCNDDHPPHFHSIFDLPVICEVLNQDRLVIEGKHFSANVVPNVHKRANFSFAYDQFYMNQSIYSFYNKSKVGPCNKFLAQSSLRPIALKNHWSWPISHFSTKYVLFTFSHHHLTTFLFIQPWDCVIFRCNNPTSFINFSRFAQ